MEKNRIILAALFASKAIRVILIGLALVFTVAFIHWHLDPGVYSEIEISNSVKSGIGGDGIRFPADDAVSAGSTVYLNELGKGMVWWMYLRTMIFLVLIWLIVQSMIRVLYSIRSLKTFHKSNVIAFRQIGNWMLLVFALSAINMAYIQGSLSLELSFPVGPLLLALLAFLLAEIFREGNRLMEENSLTI